MKEIPEKPFGVSEIRSYYKKAEGKDYHTTLTGFEPTYEYSKWIELQLAAKCRHVYVLLLEIEELKKANTP